MTGVLLMLTCSVLVSIAATLFKLATDRHGSGWALLRSWQFWMGFGCYFVSFALNAIAFRYGDITELLPLLELSLVWNLIPAIFLLGERPTRRLLLGTLLVLIGSVLLASSASA